MVHSALILGELNNLAGLSWIDLQNTKNQKKEHYASPTWTMVMVDFRSIMLPLAAGRCHGRRAVASIQGGTVNLRYNFFSAWSRPGKEQEKKKKKGEKRIPHGPTWPSPESNGNSVTLLSRINISYSGCGPTATESVMETFPLPLGMGSYIMNCLFILLPEPEQPEQPDHWSDQLSDQLNQDTVLGSLTVSISSPTFGFPITPLHSYTHSFTLH
jgi:hypothetical protein